MKASRNHREIAKRMDSIMRRLVQIEEKETEIMGELHDHLKARVKSAVHELSKYLNSDDVKRSFTEWGLPEVPKAEGSWEEINSNIKTALDNRMRVKINGWEESHQVFTNVRKFLVQHSQQRYNIVVGQLRNLQDAVTNNAFDVPETIPSKHGLTTKEKVVIGVTSPIWVPVSLVTLVIGAPVVGILEIKNKLENRSRIKKYAGDKCAFMAEASADYLNDATNENVLKVFVENQVNEAKLCLKQIEERIPELIEADKMLCKALGDVRLSQIEIQKLYQPIVDKASDIRGRLAVFALDSIRATDISDEELDWEEEISSLLGRGAFATVYQGKMRWQGEEKTVALKVFRQELDARSASSIMAEVEILR